ncbi:hypothetical protein [Actinokineospora inagensis]|uniref:hypothetical protein n=1 Tax=Actinokineospora inagensis TaxID=103730 RepID=UPI00047C4436|nr:hypothetical protein [Actinokineospora inagensis]
MTSRWAFLAALATTGALLLRHPAPAGGLGGLWWVPPLVAVGALVPLWRFPGRAWPWVLVVGGALSLADAVLWVDSSPLPEDPAARLRLVSVLTSVAAVLLVLGALGAASRLLAGGHRAYGSALGGIAVGAFAVSGPLAGNGFAPSTWDIVPFVAAGLAVAGAASGVLMSRRDAGARPGSPWLLVAGVLAAGVGVEPVGVSALVVLLGVAVFVAVHAAAETVALMVVGVVGVALVGAGARIDMGLGSRPSVFAWAALVVGGLVFGALGLSRWRAALFAITATVAGVELPLVGGHAPVLLAVGIGLVVLAGAVAADQVGGAPLVLVVVLGLVGAPAGPIGDRDLLGPPLVDQGHPTWWVAAALVLAAAFVGVSALLGRTREPVPSART